MFLRFSRTTPIESLAVGVRVVVEGRVESDLRLEVPGTDLACVYHETDLEEFRPGVRGGRAMWTPASHEEELAGFWLDDGTGSVYIQPDSGFVKVTGGPKEKGIGERRGVRFIARFILPGDVVRVRGVVAECQAAKGTKKQKKKKGKKARREEKQARSDASHGRFEIGGSEADPLVILFRKRGSAVPPPGESAPSEGGG